ncbi:hypothetical protein KQI65_16375 [bacterium]|nr:hypothetical protein [bacterium]
MSTQLSRPAMKLMFALAILLYTSSLHAQDDNLYFHPADSVGTYEGYSPLQLLPMPPTLRWKGAAENGRGIFALHSYAVKHAGPTRDRANEAVLLGWNPMGRLQPDQPGYWWQYEWGYGQGGGSLFELNLDVRDSLSLGKRRGTRRVSYKMQRRTGTGVSADFAFHNISFVEGTKSAGDKLQGNYLQISTRSNRMRANINTEFKQLVQYSVLSHSTADSKLHLPMERGTQFTSRLIPLYGAVADSTTITLNDMKPGTHYTVKLRNEREYRVHLTWEANSGRKVYWDHDRPMPVSIGPRETIVVRIIMDEDLHAFASQFGRFLEDFE